MSKRGFGRRELLSACGATLLVPAFLRQAFADRDGTRTRLVIVMQPNGTHQPAFWPDPVTRTSPILEPILANSALAAKTLVIKGVRNETLGLGNEHDRGYSSLWTGVPPIGTMEDCFGGGPSIDQMLKAALGPRTRFPTLNAGVLAADVAPKNGHRRSFSYFGPKQQVPTIVDPVRLYGALFPEQGTNAGAVSAEQRLVMKRSVLDATARDLADLSARLGPNERRKLDAHATALREYEARLEAVVTGGAACAAPGAPGVLDPSQEANVPLLADAMLDLVALALGCNLTQIVTFSLGLCGAQWRYRWLGIDQDGHEELAHRDTLDGANVPVAQAMTAISRWFAERVARFAARLEATPEDDGTVLDHSLVVWANEMGTGFHSLENLPLVVLGRASGRVTQNFVVDQGVQGHHQLGTSVLRWMGVDAEGFGDRPACGGLRL
jgi:hypothetical protein